MSTLIATLGSEPQVVTLAVDLLHRRHRPINTVVVLHTASSEPRMQLAVEQLAAEFAQHRAYRRVTYQPIVLRDDAGRPLDDVDTPAGAQSAFRALYAEVKSAKLRSEGVDICLAGGRKTMSVYAMVAAQLLFEDDDKLWHLVSYGPLLSERRMHATAADETALVELPVLRFSDVPPALSGVVNTDDPFEAVQRANTRAAVLKTRRAVEFVNSKLTPAERRAVAGLVRDGLGDAEIAERLHLSRKTVQTQLASAYRKASDFFELPDVRARTLMSLLANVAGEI
jgi:CRISPR-associated Csx14 family protein